MRIMCVFVSLTIFPALSSGCSMEEEKRERAKPERKKAEPKARKVKPLRKKAKAEKPKHTFPVLKNIRKHLLKRLRLAHLTEEQARELFKKLMPLIKRGHRLERQINKLEAKISVLIKQSKAESSKMDRDIHVLSRKLKSKKLTSDEHRRIINKFIELEHRLKAEDVTDMKVTMLTLKGSALKKSLRSLNNQVESLLTTYRKKKRNMRTNP